jgi:choice-of-anchor B domain-containing protein
MRVLRSAEHNVEEDTWKLRSTRPVSRSGEVVLAVLLFVVSMDVPNMLVPRFRFVRSVLVLVLGLLVGGGMAPAWGQSPITGETRSCTDGEVADRYPCSNVDLKSYLPVSRLGGESGTRLNDIWGWTDPETGKEYALVARTDGVAFVDVSSPTEPVYLGELPSHSGSSTWRDVKVYENHAFIVSEAAEHGMQVFDLTQLRSVSNPPVPFSETTHYDRFSTAHNVVVNTETGYAYVVGITGAQDVPSSAECGAGLHIIDVQIPDQPTFAGCHNDLSTGGQVAPGYTHDAQCVIYQGPDADYEGREICFNANERQLNIADVTDKDNPETITNATYPQPGYTHQAWLTENQRYLLVDDETDEQSVPSISNTRTLVFDVSNLDNPELATSFTGPTTAIDHNQYVLGNYSYQANYTAGFRVLDISNPENPGEAAYFDTYPASNAASFNGAWSTYPFFDSGNVLVSSIGEGLFVLQPTIAPIFGLRVEGEGQTAQLRWRVSPSVTTRQMVVEHRPPDVRTWSVVQTLEGRSRPEAEEGRSKAGTDAYTYQMTELGPGSHQFRIRHVSTSGDESVSEPVRVRVLPDDPFTLLGLPNPIRGRQAFTLVLQETQDVRIRLYDLLGRRVATLYDGEIQAGTRRPLVIAPQASGMYFLRVQGEDAQVTRKVVVNR